MIGRILGRAFVGFRALLSAACCLITLAVIAAIYLRALAEFGHVDPPRWTYVDRWPSTVFRWLAEHSETVDRWLAGGGGVLLILSALAELGARKADR